MFVTSKVSMPAASGFIHVNKQYNKTLKHIPRSLQYSYISHSDLVCHTLVSVVGVQLIPNRMALFL